MQAKYGAQTPAFWWYPDVADSATHDQSKDWSPVLATQRPTSNEKTINDEVISEL